MILRGKNCRDSIFNRRIGLVNSIYCPRKFRFARRLPVGGAKVHWTLAFVRLTPALGKPRAARYALPTCGRARPAPQGFVGNAKAATFAEAPFLMLPYLSGQGFLLVRGTGSQSPA